MSVIVVCITCLLAQVNAIALQPEPAEADAPEVTAPEVAPTVVELRGRAGSLTGTLVAADAQGVRLAGRPEALHWGLVRSVRGNGAAEAERFAEVADRVWRGLSRLARGDAAGAEPLLETLFAEYRLGSGATSRAVAEGLLACRLSRNAHAAAVEPWAVALASGSGPLRGSAALVEAVAGQADRGRLIPALAPIWTDTPAVRALATQEPVASGERAPARRLEALYRFAAARAVGLDSTGRPVWVSDEPDPELRFVAAVVFAQAGDETERAAARAELRVTLEAGVPTWAQAWARAAIGRSLLADNDRERQLLGVAELLRVPALLRDAHPYLAGLCLREAAAGVEALGMSESAADLIDEFRRSFPGHPGLGSPGGAAEGGR